MAERRHFRCRECGHETAKWHGRCPECDTWDALDERRAPARASRAGAAPARGPEAVPFPDLPADDAARSTTGLRELDRVLGGGLVRGAAVLLGGEPGIGKSTLLLQAGEAMAREGRRVLYLTGEESPGQLRLRGERLGIASAGLEVAAGTAVEGLLETVERRRPDVVFLDSIQAVRCADVGSMPGTVGQVREAASRFVERAKTDGVPLFLVGHVTKEGGLAGPRTLEHLVDTVLQFEGDRHHAHRILRSLKNRFGPSDELGVFRMEEGGLVEVQHPSELFLAQRDAEAPGSVVLAAIEGSRPLLLEIQALVGDPVQGSPRRTAVGIDGNRLAMILAVLQRRAGIDLAARDVFVSVAGGVTSGEPATDLAIAAALVSAAEGRAVPGDWVVFGEIGLTGEVRAVSRVENRLREAARMGFRHALTPPAANIAADCRVHATRDLRSALGRLLAAAPSGADRQIG